jgi:uncharacterized DUF497 family protein
MADISCGKFRWLSKKEEINIEKHGVKFTVAMPAFLDPRRIIAHDEAHSSIEPRFFCIDKIGDRIATVRFTFRGDLIRIIGAGFWRKGANLYEKENQKKHS